MINGIIDGILFALNSEFGDGYEIYTESVEQGLKEPCFLVQCIHFGDDLFRGKRYNKTNDFVIQYFPLSNEKISECNTIADKLFDMLELIKVGDDLYRGAELKGEVISEVLNFSVNYDFLVYKSGEIDPAMEELEVDTDVEG